MSVLNAMYTAIENTIVRRVRSIEAELAVPETTDSKMPCEQMRKLDERRLYPFVMFV